MAQRVSQNRFPSAPVAPKSDSDIPHVYFAVLWERDAFFHLVDVGIRLETDGEIHDVKLYVRYKLVANFHILKKLKIDLQSKSYPDFDRAED